MGLAYVDGKFKPTLFNEFGRAEGNFRLVAYDSVTELTLRSGEKYINCGAGMKYELDGSIFNSEFSYKCECIDGYEFNLQTQ
mmetsp:Transcript_26464/g.4613  ORF Transcript_26464/g.4613 Transcript_26464/m.4613 type:complete len:82 (-) Transcript_26464:2031-2276(-)